MRFDVALGHPFAFVVHDAEVELGGSVPLVGCFALPAKGLGVVLRRSFAFSVHVAESVLGGSIPLLCSISVRSSRHRSKYRSR